MTSHAAADVRLAASRLKLALQLLLPLLGVRSAYAGVPAGLRRSDTSYDWCDCGKGLASLKVRTVIRVHCACPAPLPSPAVLTAESWHRAAIAGLAAWKPIRRAAHAVGV